MKTFVAAILLVALSSTFAQNNAISFYLDNFSSADHTSTLLTECERLPDAVLKEIRFVKTDACVELHTSSSCSIYERHLPVQPTDTRVDLGNFAKSVVAFKPCEPHTGRYQDVRMKLYGNRGLLSHLPIEFNEDNCANLPSSLQFVAHNASSEICVTFFDKLDCEGSRLTFQERKNTTFPGDFRPVSYSPCNKEKYIYVPEAPTVHAKVIGAQFTVADNAMDLATKKVLSVEGTELLENNGSVPVKQLHKVKKSVEEVLDMIRLESLLSFDSMNTSTDATFTSSNDIPTFAMDKLKKSFRKAYAARQTEPKFRDVTDKDFSMEQTFEIPSCSFYEVKSVVNVVENYAVDYNVTVEVSGEWGTGRNRTDMTPEELKETVDGIDGINHSFNKVINGKNVAVAWATGSLTLSFGQGMHVKAVGAPVAQCN